MSIEAEATLMIDPPPLSFMARMAAWQPNRVPFRLMATRRSTSSSVISATGASWAMPATLAITSNPP